jgi:hypothetical protein
MRRTVGALLGAVVLTASTGCVTGPEGARFAGGASVIDVPFSAENTALHECEHSGGWYDEIAGACDLRGE